MNEDVPAPIKNYDFSASHVSFLSWGGGVHPRKTNMSPENSTGEAFLPTIIFSGAMLVFGGRACFGQKSVQVFQVSQFCRKKKKIRSMKSTRSSFSNYRVFTTDNPKK